QGRTVLTTPTRRSSDLYGLTTLPRKNLLLEVVHTAPLIVAIGGRAAVAEVADAVRQAGGCRERAEELLTRRPRSPGSSRAPSHRDRKRTRLNSSHQITS